MRVLIADEFPAPQREALTAHGLTVDYRPKLRGADLVVGARDASILIVRSNEVPAAVIDASPALTLVIRAGAGTNTIDVAAASARGVFVANCPGQNAVAVAELTWGLILALDRRIPDNVTSLREGRWRKKLFSETRGLHGRTLGVLGLGAIGLLVAKRGLAFGMRVVACSIGFTPEQGRALGIDVVEFPVPLARESDVLTVHIPGGRGTKGLVSRQVLAELKDGSYFVNTSRADVVDSEALIAEVQSGRIRAAADVYDGEPKTGDEPFSPALAALPGFYGTHHIGASTAQAQDAIAQETLRIVETFLHTGEVLNCVNVAKKTPARWQIIVRHHDRVGVLANVLGAIREAGINAQEVENTVFEGAAAACCKIQLDHQPGDEVLQRIRARADEIIHVELMELR